MIPLRDDNPTRTTPIVTVAIIALNVVVFFWQISKGLDLSVVQYGLIPAELVNNVNTVYHGRPLPPGTHIRNLDPAWMTVFSSMFMHGGWMHIIGNMWFLWIFGNNVEDAMGHVKYLLFYLASGVAAAAAQIALGPNSLIPMVGASGAIGGVLGAYLVLFPGSRVITLITTLVITTVELPAVIVLGLWFVLQFISGLGALGSEAGGVAYAAHVGGFLFGMVMGRLLGKVHPPRHRYTSTPRPDFMDWR